MFTWLLPLAEAIEKPEPPPVWPTFLMLGAFFLVMYIAVIRPQQQEEEERKTLIDGVKKNDKVITTGGILGTVTNVKDDEVTLRVDDDKNVKMKILKTAIMTIVSDKKESDSKAST